MLGDVMSKFFVGGSAVKSCSVFSFAKIRHGPCERGTREPSSSRMSHASIVASILDQRSAYCQKSRDKSTNGEFVQLHELPVDLVPGQ